MAPFFLSNTGLSCLYHKSETKANFKKVSIGNRVVFYFLFKTPLLRFTVITTMKATAIVFLIFLFTQKEQTTLKCINVLTTRPILNAAKWEHEGIMQQHFLRSFSVCSAICFTTFFIGHTWKYYLMLSDFLRVIILKCVNLYLLPRHIQLVFHVATYWPTDVKIKSSSQNP